MNSQMDEEKSSSAIGSMNVSSLKWRRYVLHLLNDWPDFRYAEFSALVSARGLFLGDIIEVPTQWRPMEAWEAAAAANFPDLPNIPSLKTYETSLHEQMFHGFYGNWTLKQLEMIQKCQKSLQNVHQKMLSTDEMIASEMMSTDEYCQTNYFKLIIEDIMNENPSYSMIQAEEIATLIRRQWLAEKYLRYLRTQPRAQHFLIVRFQNVLDLQKIVENSVLIRAAYEIWAIGESIDNVTMKMYQLYQQSEALCNELKKDENGIVVDSEILLEKLQQKCLNSIHDGETAETALQHIPPIELATLLHSKLTWCVQVNSFCRSLSMGAKEISRNAFRFLDFNGPVRLSNPSLELVITLDYSGEEPLSRPARTLASTTDLGVTVIPTTITNSSGDFVMPEELQALATEAKNQTLTTSGAVPPCYFGRRVADNSPMRTALAKYSLKKRLYLGPTSLDDSLAAILANMASVSPGMMAYEPFMGTGSIAIALTHAGSFCMGSDIDPRVLRGDMFAGGGDAREAAAALEKVAFRRSGKGLATALAHNGIRRDVLGNFEAYGLPAPELLRMDHHCLDRHWKFSSKAMDEGMFDIIVTDPPYGIRAGAKKSGSKRKAEYELDHEARKNHIPVTQTYPVEEVMLDLMHTAARTLVLGGMLVYLLPTPYAVTTECLPTHPCLRLTEVTHQPLSTRHGRRAVVMKKIAPLTEAASLEFNDYRTSVLNGDNSAGFGGLMAKLVAALSPDAFEDENVVKRMGSCSEKRRTSKIARRKKAEDAKTAIQNETKTDHESTEVATESVKMEE